jgi:MFS family permease
MATNISDSETSAPSSGRRPSSGLSTFETVKRFKDFRLVWIGNFFAQGAQWLQILTIGWLVLQLTDGNALLTGTAVGVRTLPILFIGPWAGVLADRLDRRKLIMVTQTVMAAAAVSFAILVIATDLDSETSSGPLLWWHPFIYMAISGIAHSIIQPVRQAMIANTVPREFLTKALALNGMVYPSTRIVAPALGGILIATLGFNWNFFIEAVAYVIMVLLLIPARLPFRTKSSEKQLSMLASMRGGLVYVWREKSILQLIVMSIIPNFVFTPLVFILPVFTSQVLNRGPEAGGVLAAAIGAGGIVAGVIIATVGFVVRKGLATFWGLVVGCVFVVLFAQSNLYLVSIAALVGLGFCQYIFRVGNSTLIQGTVPDDLRGRVMSIYMLDSGFVPLATLAISLLIHFWNPQDAFTAVGILALALALVQFATFKLVRRLP